MANERIERELRERQLNRQAEAARHQRRTPPYLSFRTGLIAARRWLASSRLRSGRATAQPEVRGRDRVPRVARGDRGRV
jgi:hypothetical protein